MTIDHASCGSESRQFCDDLLAALQLLDPSTSRYEKTTCGFKTAKSNRFAYLYHKQDSTAATIFLRGDDPDVIPSLAGNVRVEVRGKLTGNWAAEYPLFVHLPLGTSPSEVAMLLHKYSVPLAVPKRGNQPLRDRLNDVDLRDGKIRTVLSTRYERNRLLRSQCLAHYGYRCEGCKLLLTERYGAIADGLIHVHHVEQLSETGERVIDPVTDLIPLCPNCHAVVHLKKPPISIAALRRLIQPQ